MTAAGDDNGAATWRRITAAVEQLANNTPPGPRYMAEAGMTLQVRFAVDSPLEGDGFEPSVPVAKG
jgi:hypothetical protein